MSHMNESSHIWMSRVTYKWHVTYINASRDHVTYINASRHTYEWVTAHVWKDCDTYVSDSCHIQMSRVTHKWVMSQSTTCTTVSSAPHITMDAPCEWVTSHTKHQWVMSHMSISHVPYVNESYSEGMSHVTVHRKYMNESCHIWMSHVPYEWVV